MRVLMKMMKRKPKAYVVLAFMLSATSTRCAIFSETNSRGVQSMEKVQSPFQGFDFPVGGSEGLDESHQGKGSLFMEERAACENSQDLNGVSDGSDGGSKTGVDTFSSEVLPYMTTRYRPKQPFQASFVNISFLSLLLQN